MADITRRLGWRHLRGAPTAHIRHHRSGELAHDGTGLSFWYRALHAAAHLGSRQDVAVPAQSPWPYHFAGVSGRARQYTADQG